MLEKSLYEDLFFLPEVQMKNRLHCRADVMVGENESYIWRYFIDKPYYIVMIKINSTFINPAPFSKFYLEIDNESQVKWVHIWVGKLLTLIWKTMKYLCNNYANDEKYLKIKI
jgi:hypothetical protein